MPPKIEDDPFMSEFIGWMKESEEEKFRILEEVSIKEGLTSGELLFNFMILVYELHRRGETDIFNGDMERWH